MTLPSDLHEPSAGGVVLLQTLGEAVPQVVHPVDIGHQPAELAAAVKQPADAAGHSAVLAAPARPDLTRPPGLPA